MSEYNGWSNYETWNVKFWLDNEEGTYSACQEWAQEAWDEADGTRYEWESREQEAVANLAELLESFVDELNPLASDASVFSDILRANLQQVDYRQIARSLLEDVEQEVTS